MSIYSILRLIHIFSGVFWVGVALLMAGFILPSAKAIGPESGKFMQQLARQNRFPLMVEIASLLTLFSGLWLYWLISGGFQPSWFATKAGLSLTIGGTMASITYGLGYVFQKPAAKRIGLIGQAIQQAGGSPTAEQLADMQVQQQRLAQGNVLAAILLTLAVAGMALAR